MIGGHQDRHIVDEASGVLYGCQELPIDTIRVQHTILFGVEHNAVEWARADPGEHDGVLGWVDYFTILLL